MKQRLGLFVIIPLAMLIGGCASDSPTGGGSGDMTPPGVGSAMALDANHVRLTFSERVKKETAEHRENYVILETTPAAVAGAFTPGDTTHVNSAVLGSDGVTVTIATQEAMQNLPYELKVTGVEDLAGNKITNPVSANFAGTNTADTTPPQIVQRSPAPGEMGVGIAQSVIVQFDEPMNRNSVEGAFQWSWSSGLVSWQMQEQGDNTFLFSPQAPLMNSTLYTASLQGTAQDLAGNGLGGGTVNWMFTTTAVSDNTPPALQSSVPAHNATNVSVTTNISLTFTEAIDEASSLQEVFLTPDVGNGVLTWSLDRYTLTFDPDMDLMDDTQYSLIILPGGVHDLAGNGNTTAIEIVWSTGSSFYTGQFSGTISGDPGTQAENPAGALVIAADSNPFGSNDDFGVVGSGVVAGDGTYSVMRLPDGWYFPVSAMDSNGDGQIDPSLGDAIGAYGVVLGVDNDADSIEIAGGGSVTGIDFALNDPSVIAGRLSYSGAMVSSAPYYVGAFDTTGFDINNIPDPDFSTQGTWPFQVNYAIDEFDDNLAPGTYYVGAYFDINFNMTYDDGVDPAGFYTMSLTPTAITLANGSDALNTDITVDDPSASMATRPVSWVQKSPVDPRLRDAAARIRQALARHP